MWSFTQVISLKFQDQTINPNIKQKFLHLKSIIITLPARERNPVIIQAATHKLNRRCKNLYISHRISCKLCGVFSPVLTRSRSPATKHFPAVFQQSSRHHSTRSVSPVKSVNRRAGKFIVELWGLQNCDKNVRWKIKSSSGREHLWQAGKSISSF